MLTELSHLHDAGHHFNLSAKYDNVNVGTTINYL